MKIIRDLVRLYLAENVKTAIDCTTKSTGFATILSPPANLRCEELASETTESAGHFVIDLNKALGIREATDQQNLAVLAGVCREVTVSTKTERGWTENRSSTLLLADMESRRLFQFTAGSAIGVEMQKFADNVCRVGDDKPATSLHTSINNLGDKTLKKQLMSRYIMLQWMAEKLLVLEGRIGAGSVSTALKMLEPVKLGLNAMNRLQPAVNDENPEVVIYMGKKGDAMIQEIEKDLMVAAAGMKAFKHLGANKPRARITYRHNFFNILAGISGNFGELVDQEQTKVLGPYARGISHRIDHYKEKFPHLFNLSINSDTEIDPETTDNPWLKIALDEIAQTSTRLQQRRGLQLK